MYNIKKVRPMSNMLIATMNKSEDLEYASGSTSIIDPTSTTRRGIKEIQKVIAVGPMVRTIKEGDTIHINFSRYAVKKYAPDTLKGNMDELTNQITGYNLNTIILNGKMCLVLFDSDIDFIVDDYEEVHNPIIDKPEKTKLITHPEDIRRASNLIN